MYRNAIIAALGASEHERLLKEHLLFHCSSYAASLQVVSEIEVFLVRMGYFSLLGQLNPDVSVEHLVIDFTDTVTPCLLYGGSR